MSVIREINVDSVAKAVARLCIQANLYLPPSLEECINDKAKLEMSPVGKGVFDDLKENLKAARAEGIPICQDCGMAVVFIEVGQDVHFVGGSLRKAIDSGVAEGYTEGKLRCSVVADPLERINTGDNTPAVVHMKLVDGDSVKITVAPKGFGSENMSQLRMFTPAASGEDIIDFVENVVSQAGSNPCPPIVVGVGIGGDFEKCAYLAKLALCRDVNQRNPLPLYEQLEKDMLERINRLGIGPQGFGGTVTALAVNIEQAPTHIAGLPVAVNVGCHVTRHAQTVL